MSNGRRAWRKWLKSQRKHAKDSWAADIGACLGRAAYARRHRGTDAGQGLPDVVPTDGAASLHARFDRDAAEGVFTNRKDHER